jgi:heptosyltransferase-2
MTPLMSKRGTDRILVIRSGGLGDFILTLPVLATLREEWPAASIELLTHPEMGELAIPVLAALREEWPAASIELLTHPEMGELAKAGGFADRIHSIDDSRTAALFAALPSVQRINTPIAHQLEGCDLVVSFWQDPDGILEETLRLLIPRVLCIPKPREGKTHAAAQFLSSLRPLGIRTEAILPSPPLVHLVKTSTPFGDRVAPPVAVHPGSGSYQKNWDTSGFAGIILWLQEELGQEAIVISGEADTKVRTCLLKQLGDKYPREMHSPTLRELVAILQNCRLFIGNDSGVSHLAAALGTPVLAFFGPTSPEVWQPLGEKVRVVRFTEASPERVQREIRSLL